MEYSSLIEETEAYLSKCVDGVDKIIGNDFDNLFIQVIDRQAYDEDLPDEDIKLLAISDCHKLMYNKKLLCLFIRAFFLNNYVVCYGMTFNNESDDEIEDTHSKNDNKYK